MIVTIVVPVYNERECIGPFYDAVTRECDDLADQVQLLFVNDGSTDETQHELDVLAENDPRVHYVAFTRNFGKEAALYAGLEHAQGDAVIPMDVDLQDPVEVVPELIAKWHEGADVVLARRIDRNSDGWLKRTSAHCFYRIHNTVARTKLEENVGDFRLLSRPIVNSILKLHERNLFMKGVYSWPGGSTATVEYTRPARHAGRTKFHAWKLWNLALEGITGFSTLPLRVWTYLGAGVAVLSFLYAAIVILNKLLWGNDVPGYASLMVSVLFLGGVQLVGIGVLGEYVGRIYTEVKHRPRYLVDKEK